MMIPSVKIWETKRKRKPRKKDEIHLRYINLDIYLEVPTEASERDIQQVVRGQNIYTWEISVYKLKLNL